MIEFLLAEPIEGTACEHGEGPIWCSSDSKLRWLDMLRGEVLALDPISYSVSRTKVAGLVASLRPREEGGFVLGLERGFGLLDEKGLTHLSPTVLEPGVRMNDGSCDTLGRFYCGSMSWDGTPGAGGLFRLDPDGTVTQVLSSVTISNGLAFSPDGAFALYVDSASQTVAKVTVTENESGWASREPIVEIDPAIGTPDGLCMDSEGGFWVALWDGAAVHRFDVGGNLTHVVKLPVDRPTSCALGGEDLKTLFITTSRLDKDLQPFAGQLHSVRVEVPGIQTLAFGG